MINTVLKNDDVVHIKRLSLNANIGPNCWDQPIPQSVKLSMNMETDFRKASEGDDLKYSLNYAVISRDLVQFTKKHNVFLSLAHMAHSIKEYILPRYPGIIEADLELVAEDAHIRSNAVTACVSSSLEKTSEIVISGLKVLTVIGVFTFERYQKQYVDLEIRCPLLAKEKKTPSYKDIIGRVVNYVEDSNFKTVEALVEKVAQVVLLDDYYQANSSLGVHVKVLKLNAITETEGVGVSCLRTSLDFQGKTDLDHVREAESGGFDLPVSEIAFTKSSLPNRAYLAIGSNVGSRFNNILMAISLLNEVKEVEVIQVSSLFESEPMYYKDQSRFLNGVLEISTTLQPQELLELCKEIEYKKMKREKQFDNCPRIIDLDIIFYVTSENVHMTINTASLVIPHPRMLERSFVLEPLCELLPVTEVHPITAELVHEHLKQLYESEEKENILWKVVPIPGKLLGNEDQCRFLRFKKEYEFEQIGGSFLPHTKSQTYLMGILNVTPDSFSDGNDDYKDIGRQLDRVKEMVGCGLELHSTVLIDVGGCSTRPGSKQIDLEEEIERVIPLIKAIKNCKELSQERLILAVDTYRSKVARLAIEAGVDIINDISGGSLDPEMFSVVAEHPNVAYVLSHFRGDISTMSGLVHYSEAASSDGIIEYLYGREIYSQKTTLIRNIARELALSYQTAVSKGVRRWQIILDPGVGFSKKTKQNIEIVNGTPFLKNYSCLKNGQFTNFCNLPVMLGPSRKKFIGDIIKEHDAGKRDFATGAIVASCVGFEADIVRVHDVLNCSKALKLADLLYRG